MKEFKRDAAKAASLLNSFVNDIITPSGYTNMECLGGKTGTSKSAGNCLVAYGRQNGKTFISVVLGAKTTI